MAAKKTATKKRAARKRTTRKITEEENIEKVIDGMKKLMLASLGVYGEAFDEIKTRLKKARTEGSSRYDEFVKRGEKLQSDAKKKFKEMEFPSEDMKDNLEKMRDSLNDLMDTVFARD